MPLYKPEHVEHNIVNGNIQIVMDDGSNLPAYWSHPTDGSKYPGVALIHNWWGVTPIIRRMAHLFAQTGYYVIVPDLFDGARPTTPQAAMKQVEKLGDNGYPRIHAALSVLEGHHKCNANVAAVGIGMGGSLAFEAAIIRPDLEAAVAYYGFPQKSLGRFEQSNTPILAIYGTQDTIIQPVVVRKLALELGQTSLKDKHKVVSIKGASHDFVSDNADEPRRKQVLEAWTHTVSFIEQYLDGPAYPPKKQKVY